MTNYTDTIKYLFSIAKNKKIHFVQFFISSILSNLATLLPPIATAGIISIITNDSQEFNGIWFYVLLYLVFYVLHFAFLYWNYFTYNILAGYYRYTIQRQLFEHIVNNPSILEEFSKGKITDTCSEDTGYLINIIDASAKTTSGLIQLVTIFFIFCFQNIFVAIIAISIDVIYIVLMNENSKSVSRHYEGARKYRDKVTDTLNQVLNNIRQVKSMDILPKLDQKLEKSQDSWNNQNSSRYNQLASRYCKLPMIVHSGKILLYIILAYLVNQKHMTVDQLVLLVSYFEMIIKYTNEILEYLLNLNNYNIRFYRIKTILEYTPSSVIEYGSIDNDYINGVVVFDKVSCAIDGRVVLNNVSFKALPNEITAIVGRPGSGKTTIINLLYRLRHLKSGSILIDDESIYNYSKSVYASNVSGVFQKAFIFDMSIKDNLTLIEPNVKKQIAACKRVGIHKIIEKLPNGYNTILDQEHDILSDGQIQKLAIARAILSKAEILLFDEVTSNIDPSSTLDIIKILQDLKEDHTVIIITHKPEVMLIADQIIVLKDGKVSCKGKNKDVYKKSALYRTLASANFTGPSNDDEDDII